MVLSLFSIANRRATEKHFPLFAEIVKEIEFKDLLTLKIHLYTTFYNEKNESRKAELLACIQKNADNPSIASLTVFNEGDSMTYLKPDKIKDIQISKRPTYNDFISHINNHSTQDDIHIIANTDIFFDEHIAVLEDVLYKNSCFALSRWDTTDSDKPLLYNHNDSQDVWIFKGNIKETLQADFPLGVPRCDNRFLYELEVAGYKVLNPSLSIKAYHMHKGQRALVYTEADNRYQIPKPYRYKYPHNLFGLWKTFWHNTIHPNKIGHYQYDPKKVNRWLVVRLLRKPIEAISGKKLPLIGYQNES